MRTVTITRLAPLLGALALALAAAPANARAADTTFVTTSTGTVVPAAAAVANGVWTGVFRVHLALAGKDAAPAAIVFERAFDAPSGFMLVDSRGAPLSAIRIDGDVLRARVATANGVGDLTLRLDGGVLTGTLQVGRQRWDVSGQKTA